MKTPYAMALSALVIALCSQPTAANEPSKPEIFLETVWPVLKKHCLACHGPFYQLQGLSLESSDAILRGGDNGPVVQAGDSSASEIVRRISLPDDDPGRMPQKAERLDEVDIEAIRHWIDLGASFGSFVDADSASDKP